MSIRIFHQNGYFFVWNANDAIRLRREHRIVGALIGARPEYPREEKSTGLPLVLKDVQVRLLQELNVVTIVQQIQGSSDYLKQQSNVELSKSLQINEASEMASFLKEQRLQEIEHNFERIYSGKVKKLEKSFSPEEEAQFRVELRDQLLNSVSNCPPNNGTSLVRFKVESPFCSSNSVHILPEMTSVHDSLRFETFKFFWSKGYFVTDALKFAADFMVYDDDPIQFHAKFVVFCCSKAEERSRFHRVLCQAYGRMGKNVRKNILLASFDDSTKVKFEHVEWTHSN